MLIEKRICFVLLCSLAILCTELNGQNAETLIKNASKYYDNGEFQKSIESLDLAKAQIEKQQAELLVGDLLPPKIGEFELSDTDEESINSLINRQFYIARTYKADNGKSEKKQTSAKEENIEFLPGEEVLVNDNSLQLSFTNKSASSMEIIQKHNGDPVSMDEMHPEDEIQGEIKSVKIKNHRAIIQYNKWQKQGRISVMVGATVIELVGNGIESEEILLNSIGTVDFEKVLKKFGV